MPFGIGFGELILIFAVLLLVFGAKRLPEIGGAMGKSIRDFKHSINGLERASTDESIQPQSTPPSESIQPRSTPPSLPSETPQSQSTQVPE